MAIETVLNYIEELEKEKQQVLDDYQEPGKDLHDNFIPKQVILDKIEELKQTKVLIVLENNKELMSMFGNQITVLQEILNKGEKDE